MRRHKKDGRAKRESPAAGHRRRDQKVDFQSLAFVVSGASHRVHTADTVTQNLQNPQKQGHLTICKCQILSDSALSPMVLTSPVHATSPVYTLWRGDHCALACWECSRAPELPGEGPDSTLTYGVLKLYHSLDSALHYDDLPQVDDG